MKDKNSVLKVGKRDITAKYDRSSEITKSDLRKTFFRSNFLLSSSNFERMGALGAYYTMVPILKRLYKDAPHEERVAAIKRHLEFFNTNPWLFPSIAGVTAAMEVHTPEKEKEAVISVRTGLMGPLAGLGDSFLALTIMPIILILSIGLAMDGNVFAPLVYFILFSLWVWPIKWFGFMQGFKSGSQILTGNKGTTILKRLSTAGNVLGMMIVGNLIVRTIRVNVATYFQTGPDADGNYHNFRLQEMLDGIMPALLPFILTIVIYKLMKRKNAKNAVFLIFVLMAIGILLSILGILH